MRNITNFYKSVLGMIILLVISALSVHKATAQSFTKITSSPLVSETASFLGASWGDYDKDGNVDLFVANYLGANALFHNDGNGIFTKVTSGEIAIPQQHSYSGTWGDYDNDNDLDLFVTIDGGANLLYRNDNGDFTRIFNGAIVTDGGNSVSASWGDYDNDGYIDLFVVNNGQKNLLYHNNRNGTFTKITTGDIVNDISSGVVGLWADYDNDGDLDLYVVNGWFGEEKNFLYRNEGEGNFTKITVGAIVNDLIGSTGGSWGDYDNDGDLDLYVTNSLNDSKNSLYSNNGDGTFKKITLGAIVNDNGASVGSSWIDYDNDGDLDLFVINSHGQKNSLYQNNGDGTFKKITSGPIVNDVGWSFGCSWADYDNDGDQDLFVTNGGFFYRGTNFLYQNEGNQNNWISIQCQGTASNFSAIGATVHVKATIYGKATWQMQQISGQTGFLGQNSLNAEFGLGDATIIDSIKVKWPAGTTQILTNVSMNQFLKITEPFAYQHDLMVITSPDNPNFITILSKIHPKVIIRNIGSNDESNIKVTCQIDSSGVIIYSHTQNIEKVASLESKTVDFAEWNISVLSNYNAKFFIHLVNDENQWNDTLYTTITSSNLVDDFETGFFKWEANTSWDIYKTLSHSGIYCLSSAPQGAYENNTDAWVNYKFSIDLSKVKSAYLSYWTKYLTEEDHDFGFVEVSVDNGTTWQQLGDRYSGSQIRWIEETRSLAAYCGTGFSDVRLRFHFISDSTKNFAFGWMVDDVMIHIGELPTGITNKETERIPADFVLGDNYPNPFNPETTIGYELSQAGLVRLEIYNMLGQKIKTLVDQNEVAGIHQAVWNGKNDRGEAVASGIYLYRMETNHFKATRRMLLIR